MCFVVVGVVLLVGCCVFFAGRGGRLVTETVVHRPQWTGTMPYCVTAGTMP
jgi:hypothetical protein